MRTVEDLIYDVGMHRGEDTAFYLMKGFNVIGFEADPKLVEYCKIRFQDAIVSGRLHIVEGAIAPTSAGNRINFFQSEVSVWGSIDPEWRDRNSRRGCISETIVLDRVDINEAYKFYGIPYYLKIDVEGVDTLVMEGLRQFKARPKYISLESNKVDFTAVEAELSLLRKLGYSKFKAVQQGSLPGTTIEVKTRDGRQFEYLLEPHTSGPFGEDIPLQWMSHDDVLKNYEAIFRRYRRFGDRSVFIKAPRRLRRVIELMYKAGSGYRGLLYGWFDTHASL